MDAPRVCVHFCSQRFCPCSPKTAPEDLQRARDTQGEVPRKSQAPSVSLPGYWELPTDSPVIGTAAPDLSWMEASL